MLAEDKEGMDGKICIFIHQLYFFSPHPLTYKMY